MSLVQQVVLSPHSSMAELRLLFAWVSSGFLSLLPSPRLPTTHICAKVWMMSTGQLDILYKTYVCVYTPEVLFFLCLGQPEFIMEKNLIKCPVIFLHIRLKPAWHILHPEIFLFLYSVMLHRAFCCNINQLPVLSHLYQDFSFDSIFRSGTICTSTRISFWWGLQSNLV